MVAEFFRDSATASSYAGLAILSLTLGYWIGVGSNLGISRGSDDEDGDDAPLPAPEKDKNSESEEDDDEDAAADGDLRNVQAAGLEECKLVRCTRTTL